MEEIWIPIEEVNYVLISNLGRIRNEDRVIVEKTGKVYVKKGIMYKLRPTKRGYLRVCIRINGQSKDFYIHRLVVKYFLGKEIKDLEVNHKDGDKKNNKVSNLEIVTYLENIKHAKDNKLFRNGENHGLSYLTSSQVLEIRSLYKDGLTNRQIADKFNLKRRFVWEITTRKTWKYLEEI